MNTLVVAIAHLAVRRPPRAAEPSKPTPSATAPTAARNGAVERTRPTRVKVSPERPIGRGQDLEGHPWPKGICQTTRAIGLGDISGFCPLGEDNAT